MNLTGPPIALHSTDYLAEQLELLVAGAKPTQFD